MRYVLFVKDACPFCVKAEELLNDKGLDFKSVSFEPEQEGLLQEMKDAYHWQTVPMVFQVSAPNQPGMPEIKFIGGYTDLIKFLDE